ncbi:MAG: DUF6624 domain-containing protein [Alphaproteobacteria bacterium]
MTESTFNPDELFSLASPEGLEAPLASPVYHPSSLQFLESIHRRKSDALKEIVLKQGWPDNKSYDGHAEAAAFMIVQHADYDLEFQELCHKYMLGGVKLGCTSPGFLAFLTDRILCNQGKHQRFGTQIREVTNGCFVPKPIENPDTVDALRREVGLTESLSDYFLRVNNGDLLLYRPLLNGYAEELEMRREHKIIEFPGNPH